MLLPLMLICSRHPTVVNVHPSVLASILTHHSRRPDAPTPRVIGTLMGTRSESGTSITVRSSFAVPHSEDDEKIALDMPFHQAMVELLSKNGAKESIVGWYATSPVINSYSALIQNYFTNETSPFPAVHLTVDTELTRDGQGLGVKAWVSSQLGTTPKPEHCVFLPVPVQVKFDESERAARESHPFYDVEKRYDMKKRNRPPTHADSQSTCWPPSPPPAPPLPPSRLSPRPSPSCPTSSTNACNTSRMSTAVRSRETSRSDDTFWRDSDDGPARRERREASRLACRTR